VVVTTGALAKLQSNRHHQQTNTQLSTGRMPFLSLDQQLSKHWTGYITPWRSEKVYFGQVVELVIYWYQSTSVKDRSDDRIFLQYFCLQSTNNNNNNNNNTTICKAPQHVRSHYKGAVQKDATRIKPHNVWLQKQVSLETVFKSW